MFAELLPKRALRPSNGSSFVHGDPAWKALCEQNSVTMVKLGIDYVQAKAEELRVAQEQTSKQSIRAMFEREFNSMLAVDGELLPLKDARLNHLLKSTSTLAQFNVRRDLLEIYRKGSSASVKGNPNTGTQKPKTPKTTAAPKKAVVDKGKRKATDESGTPAPPKKVYNTFSSTRSREFGLITLLETDTHFYSSPVLCTAPEENPRRSEEGNFRGPEGSEAEANKKDRSEEEEPEEEIKKNY